MEKEVWRRLSIGDLARMNAKRANQPKRFSKGDMVTVVDPFGDGVDYCGLVIEVESTGVILYHGIQKKQMKWPLNVKCTISKL